jgi:hypothetical protein
MREKRENVVLKIGRKMMSQLSVEDFVLLAIKKLRTGEFKGIHSVYSGFNEAFKIYFNGADPVQATSKLAREGKIVIRPVRGGVILYQPEEAPALNRGELALEKMGLPLPENSASNRKRK